MNNALNVRIILFACLFFFSLRSGAQDIHFSQIHSVPQMLNPAASAIMEPHFRISNNYRNQWRQIDIPYVSNYLSAETRFKFLGRPIGLGTFLVHDQSSSLYLTADKFYVSINHSFFYKNHQFVVGLQPGLVLKSFDGDAITFGSQFDPNSEVYNPNLPSGEDMLEDAMNYFDLNFGLFWRSKINKIYHTAGFSISHINRPVESFYNRNDSTRLPLKYTVHGNIVIPIAQKFELTPQYLFTTTAGSNEFIAGALASYYPGISQLAVKKLYVLSHYRVNPFETFDAVILGAGLTFHSLDLCISYDVTVSTLRKASRVQRAFEISLIYQFNQQKTAVESEPCFML